jgi:hypothetical protein
LVLHPTAADYTLISRAHGTFSKNFIIPCILTDHNGIKSMAGKTTKTIPTHGDKHHHLNDQWVIEEIKKFLDSNKHNFPEPVGYSKSNLKKKIYSYEHPHQKIREISNKQT